MKPTSEHIDQAVWEIWKFVRVNKNSLNSGECCKRIRAFVEMRVEEISTERDVMARQLREANERIRRLKQEAAIREAQAI